MKRYSSRILALLPLVPLVFMSSCATLQVDQYATPPPPSRTTLVWGGVVPVDSFFNPPAHCTDVYIEKDFFEDVVSFLTLGFLSPMEVTFRTDTGKDQPYVPKCTTLFHLGVAQAGQTATGTEWPHSDSMSRLRVDVLGGVVHSSSDYVVSDCPKGYIKVMKWQKSPLDFLISFVTLGLVSPYEVTKEVNIDHDGPTPFPTRIPEGGHHAQ